MSQQKSRYLLISTPYCCVKRLYRNTLTISDSEGRTTIEQLGDEIDWAKIEKTPFKHSILLQFKEPIDFKVNNHPYFALKDMFSNPGANLGKKAVEIHLIFPKEPPSHMYVCCYRSSCNNAVKIDDSSSRSCPKVIQLLTAALGSFTIEVFDSSIKVESTNQLHCVDRYCINSKLDVEYLRTVKIPLEQSQNSGFFSFLS